MNKEENDQWNVRRSCIYNHGGSGKGHIESDEDDWVRDYRFGGSVWYESIMVRVVSPRPVTQPST